MKRALKAVLTAILLCAALVSSVSSVYGIFIRVQRSDWLVAAAEVTFIGTPDGVVFGTFTDNNGTVYTDQAMYIDGGFQPAWIIKGPPRKNPDMYVGGTVRIMYRPQALNSIGDMKAGVDIDSYDRWLRDLIVSGTAFPVSAAALIINILNIKERGK